MVPLGCPLCCRQDFVSVGALHDHLLYYTYRPLQCAVCSAHVGGIQDFTRHLEMHMGDGMPTSLHAHAVKPSVPVLEDSRSEVQIEVQGRTQGRVGSRDGSSSYLCSQLINNDQTNITRSYPTNEESIELILRAYFCQTCGAKVVGKDAYFLHIREHSIVPSNNNSLTLSATVGSCPEVSSPALSSHLASDASTPGNFMTDTETLPVNESEEPSECLSDFIEENDMANQLLKIREWQLEKLGKNIKRHKFSFGRSTGLSEQSPMGGKLRNDYSPVTPSSVEIAPISESSCSPYASMQSDNTYLYSVERHDSCPPSSSVCADQGLAERSDTYNSFPLVNRESLTTDPCSVGRPDSSVPSIVTDDGSINMYPCSVETPLSCNTLTSTDKGLLTTYSYTEGEPDLLCSQMKSGNGSFNDGGQVLSWLGPNTVINDETKSSSHLVTGPSSIMKSDTEQLENISQSHRRPSPSIEREVPFYKYTDISSDKTSVHKVVQSSPIHPGTLDSLVDASNCDSPPQLDNLNSTVFASSSWISPHQYVQELELQPFSKPSSSFPVSNEDTSEYSGKGSGKSTDIQHSSYHKSSGSPSQSTMSEGSCNYMEAKLSHSVSLKNNLEDSTKLITNYISYDNQMPTTSLRESDAIVVASDKVKETAVSDQTTTEHEGNYATENKQCSQHDAQEITAIEIATSLNNLGSVSTNCLDQVNNSQDNHGSDSLPAHSLDAKPYFHKKFHHDQERKVLGQSADVNRYIHSFQSLLVNKLNGTLSADIPFGSTGISSDLSSNKKQEDASFSQPSKVQQQLQLKEHVCQVCSLKCASRSTYKSHYKTHEAEGQKNFTCQFCGQNFFKKSSKDLHERKHTGKKIHRCGDCGKVFTKLFRYLRHQREVHAVKKSFICAECSKAFSTERRLKEHIGVHQREKTHKCLICKHACHTASGLRTHILEVHSETQKLMHSCKVCGEKFTKQYGLKRHMHRKHVKQQLSCEICSKVFSCNEDLLQHKKIHTNIDTLRCDHCEKTFTTSWALQRHSKSHQEATHQFKCDKCSLNFTRKDSLVSHLKIHAQKRLFICHCGKRFVKKSQLKEHEDKHSTVPKYSCRMCKHSFKFKVSLRNHSCKSKVATNTTVSEDQS